MNKAETENQSQNHFLNHVISRITYFRCSNMFGCTRNSSGMTLIGADSALMSTFNDFRNVAAHHAGLHWDSCTLYRAQLEITISVSNLMRILSHNS